jgi:hypothetical protein
MTRTEWNKLTLDEALEWAEEHIDKLTCEDWLISHAKNFIDNDDLGMALHILSAIYNSEPAYNGWYRYDYSMGMLETPTPITCKEDIEDLVDFEDEK